MLRARIGMQNHGVCIMHMRSLVDRNFLVSHSASENEPDFSDHFASTTSPLSLSISLSLSSRVHRRVEINQFAAKG